MLTTQLHVFATWLKAQFKSDRGATMVEYALLVALIGIVLIGAWTFLADGIDSAARDAGSVIESP